MTFTVSNLNDVSQPRNIFLYFCIDFKCLHELHWISISKNGDLKVERQSAFRVELEVLSDVRSWIINIQFGRERSDLRQPRSLFLIFNFAKLGSYVIWSSIWSECKVRFDKIKFNYLIIDAKLPFAQLFLANFTLFSKILKLFKKLNFGTIRIVCCRATGISHLFWNRITGSNFNNSREF